MSSIVIAPYLRRMIHADPSWCHQCDHTLDCCVCNPDQPIRESSSVLRFMQRPDDERHCQAILHSACAHLIGREGFALLVAVGMSAEYNSALYLNIQLARMSKRVQLGSILADGYDHENQAWLVSGKYVSCSHPKSIDCRCFGRLHEGENVRA